MKLALYTKTNTKWTKELNKRSVIRKLLEKKNIKASFLRLVLEFISWLCHQKHRKQQQKLKSGTCITLKTSAKQRSSKMKWQPTEWEKIFAKYISYNGLVLKIFLNYTTQLKNNPV